MSSSDGFGKAKRAVLVRLTQKGDEFFLNLDDVEEQLSRTKTWIQREPITLKQIDPQSFDRLELDEKELADFGYYVVARLHAFRSMGET